MRLGQQVRIAGERGPLQGLTGTVEKIQRNSSGRTFYLVRLPPPYADVLHSFKIWEVHRTH